LLIRAYNRDLKIPNQKIKLFLAENAHMSNPPCHNPQATGVAPSPKKGKISPKSLACEALPKLPGKVPLRAILVVPFVLQIFAAVGLTGWLSLRNGQEAIQEVTLQLRGEISARIEQKLKNYLQAPRVIARINTDGILLGNLNPEETASLTRQFWRQRFLFESANVSAMYFGGENGEFIGLGFQESQRWEIGRAGKSTDGKFTSLAIDEGGNPTTVLEVGGDYDPRIRPWYQKAVTAGKPSWSDVYPDFKERRLKVTLAEPVYQENGELLGVVGVDFVLSHINEFLETVRIGKTGQTFIIERSSGLLIASSTTEKPFVIDGEDVDRLKAEDSENPLIGETAKYLRASFGSFDRIHTSRQLEFKIEGKRHFLQVLPFTDGDNLDWAIVVVVPESDFMEKIDANTRTTILLCVVALLVATGLGIATARWIALPIMRLSSASRALARRIQSSRDAAGGKFYEKVDVKGVDELGVLAESFNLMAEQLQESFQALERTNIELEERVARRTAALSRSEEKFSVAFHASPDAIAISNIEDGKFIEVNDSFLSLTGYSREEIIGKSAVEVQIWANLEDRDRLMKLLLEEGKVRHQEYEFRIKSGEIRVGLLSAQIIELDERAALLFMVNDITERKQAEKALQLAKEEAEQAREKSDRLLLNILPGPIAERLKKSEGSIAERFEKATVLFADIVGFTPLSAQVSPLELVCLLNQIFSYFDRLTEKHGLEKIKTIGDAYMVAGGLPIPREDCAVAIALMALDMQEAIANFKADFKADLKPEQSEQFKIRIGINTGPVVAGVIGTKKIIYDLWGDTVNVASRMESSGEPGQIQVTASTYELLKDQFIFETRGEIDVKGKGKMMTYWLTGR
jgi:PAS domain S-box-containing protein